MAQREYESLLHKTYPQRVDRLKIVINMIIDSYPDSARVFQKIEQFRDFAVKHNDKELILEADMLPVYYFKKYRLHNGELYSRSLQAVIKKAENQKILTTEARARALLANYYFQVKESYELAFGEYFKLDKLMENIPYAAYPDKLANIYLIGEAYYFFADYPQTIKYCRKAIKFRPVEFNKSPFNNAQNTLGLCYQILGKLDSSDYYFNLLLDKKAPSYMPVWENIARGNLGYNSYLRGDYQKAIPNFRADIRSAIEIQDWGLASGSLMPLADVYLKLNRGNDAEKLLLQARGYIGRSGQYRRYAMLYPLMSKLYASKGDLRLSNLYLDSALYVKDSLAKKFSALQLLRAKQKADIQQHRAEIAKVDSERKIKTLERNLLLAVVMLLVVLAVYIYHIQRKKYGEKSLMMSLDLENKEKELQAAVQQLDEFAKNIVEKNKLIESLENQFGENSTNATLEELRQLTIITDEGWERFRIVFSQVHSGYLQRLKEKMPGLTPAETRFMALAKLRLSNKEMGAVLGISTQSVRNIGFRLRKKLGLLEAGSLEELAENI
ncbi:MAG: tetratricopeptide repeat protein [Mucilaginibacter sp.]